MNKEFHTWDIKIDPVLPGREVVVAYLNECGFTMFEPSDHGVIAHGDTSEVDVKAARDCLDEVRSFAKVQCDFQLTPEENWNADWESDYPQVVITNELGKPECTIRAPFHSKPSEGIDVVVAPQMSFGTGHHATTHLMTETLIQLDLTNAAVMDMGCGTGVLALVAAKRGATSVLGIDIEVGAVRNSLDNVKLNSEIELTKLTFEQGDGSVCDSMDDEVWDVIFANIQKNVLMADMHRYTRTLKDGGHLLLSGFFEGDVSSMTKCVTSHGLVVAEVRIREGWACMFCGKPLQLG